MKDIFKIVILFACLAIVSCTKKEGSKVVETTTTNSEPLVTDYRDAFVGTYSGVSISYSDYFFPSTFTHSHTESAPVNISVNYSIVNDSDSLIKDGSNNKTYLINSSGSYYRNSLPWLLNKIKFFGDSVVTDYYFDGTASGVSGSGIKFRGKKN